MTASDPTRAVNPTLSATPFVDIHCHILPGIDDGARNREEALAMARIAVNTGAGIVATTPHNFPRSAMSAEEESQHRVGLLQRAVIENRIPLSLVTGQEIAITVDLETRIAENQVARLNGTRYMLVEPPFITYPDYLETSLRMLLAAGIRPILAHPERNTVIQESPEMLRELIQSGLIVQLNTGSLLGDYGFGPRVTASLLLRNGMVHVLATDAHSATGDRVPNMRAGFEAAARQVGEEPAWALTRHNPLAIVEGRDLPIPQPVSPADPPIAATGHRPRT